MEKLKVIIVTQARLGSTRFPGKILRKVNNTTLLELHLMRAKGSKMVSDVVVATTFEDGVDKILAISKKNGVLVSQGSTNDVLDRFYQAAKAHQPDYVVRLTSDCPLIDADLIDEVICSTIEHGVDYGSNTLIEDFPDGQDIEVIRFSTLEMAWKEATLDSEREHVTPFIRKNCSFYGKKRFSAINYPAPAKMSKVRMTVDEPDDLEAIKRLVDTLGTDAGWREYAEFITKNKGMLTNQHILRNEGYWNSINKDNR